MVAPFPAIFQVIEPVRSRCLCVRIAAPTHDDICDMITHVGAEEGIDVPEELKFRLAKVCTSSKNAQASKQSSTQIKDGRKWPLNDKQFSRAVIS